ncbi:MAG: rhomboid family intramembrane serine protease [Bacteroidota bacterium]|nr:rhomboid family intramembrane serine protease [Bacteroidota bacterium]
MFSGLTVPIIIITVLVSVPAFGNASFLNSLIFDPYEIKKKNQWYKFISSGFLHANFVHLAVNMFVLMSFGPLVEHFYNLNFGSVGMILYLILYISSIAAANITTYFKQQNNTDYRALGASGAVSAILFAAVLFEPKREWYLYGIIEIPGYIAAGLYLLYSHYASRNTNDHINHDAHFYGALYGIAFTLVCKPSLFLAFLNKF